MAIRGRIVSASSRLISIIWFILICGLLGWASWQAITFAAAELTWSDVGEAVLLGLVTLSRVVILMILASLVWVPIGVWLGLRPTWARRAQPLAQFLAAFPANLFFPVFVIVIVHFQLNRDIWLTPLMVLGTQWYILFNVVAGAAAFPGDLREVAGNFRVGGFLWWRKVMIPGIFPYYITGAITASGGCWNAAIVAEVVSWGNTKLVAHGLGAYIAQATERGDMARVVLGVAVMSAFVLTFNRLLWHPTLRLCAPQTDFGITRKMDAPLLEVIGCRQAYHKEASADLVVLEDVNLALREGEIVALSGSVWIGKVDLAANCLGAVATNGRKRDVAR